MALKRLALMSALNCLHSLPVISGSADLALSQHLQTDKNFMGYVNPSSLRDKIDIEYLRDYAIRTQDNCPYVAEGDSISLLTLAALKLPLLSKRTLKS